MAKPKVVTPTPTPTPTPTTPQATFTPPVAVTPLVRKGTSTIQHPVGVTWVTCHNLTLGNGGTPPARKVLHAAVMGLGVAYYTTRTQVQRYLAWVKGGSNPTQVPKGVNLPTP